MTKQPYNPELIRDYLLGASREDEAELLDELSFTDDAFVVALAAAENDLVDAYVQNELTSEELENFRSHYLNSPLRRQRAQFAEGLKTITEKDSIPSNLIPTKPSLRATKTFDWSSPLRSAFGSRSIVRWALIAATVAFLAFSIWLGIQNSRLRQEVASTRSQLNELQERQQEIQKQLEDQRLSSQEAREENQTPLNEPEEQQASDEQQRNSQRQPVRPTQSTIASFTLTPQMRSVGANTVVSLPPDTLDVRMNLRLEPNDYQSYTVALVDRRTNQVLWRSGKLDKQKGSGDTLEVNLRAILLKPGPYGLQLSGTSADGGSEFITQYPFKVVKQ